MADPISGAALIGAAGLSAFGGMAGSAMSAGLQYHYQKKLQRQQQQWQEKMSNTAHQREKADLLAAGINPLYTATGGSGASTPTGGMGQAGLTNMGENIQKGIASAYELKLLNKQIEKIETEIDEITGNPSTIKGKILRGKTGELENGIEKSVEHIASSVKDKKEKGAALIKGRIEKNEFINNVKKFKEKFHDWNEKNAFFDEQGRRLIDIDKQIRKKYKAY